MKHIPVKDNPSLVRDPSTGAICNINKVEITLAKKRKERMFQQKMKQETLEQEVETLKDDVCEIKTLLNKILEKL